jgi:hypothetical protein
MRRGWIIYNARRNPFCTRSRAWLLRGHRQYIVQIPAMTRLAATHQNKQSATVCMRPPISLRICDSGLQTSLRSIKAGMSSMQCENVGCTAKQRLLQRANNAGILGSGLSLIWINLGQLREIHPFGHAQDRLDLCCFRFCAGAFDRCDRRCRVLDRASTGLEVRWPCQILHTAQELT